MLYPFFSPFLERFPCVGAQTVDFRLGGLLTAELRYLVKRMYAHVEDVTTGINKFYRLLRMTADVYFLQSAETAHPVVDMGDVIPYFEFGKLRQAQGLGFGILSRHGKTLVTLEYLVVRITCQRRRCIDKTLMQRTFDRSKTYILAYAGKNIVETARLRFIGADYHIVQSFRHIVAEILGQQLEILMEYGLRHHPAFQGFVRCEIRPLRQFHHFMPRQSIRISITIQEKFFRACAFDRTFTCRLICL